MLPKLNRKRALFVLTKIDEISCRSMSTYHRRRGRN